MLNTMLVKVYVGQIFELALFSFDSKRLQNPSLGLAVSVGSKQNRQLKQI